MLALSLLAVFAESGRADTAPDTVLRTDEREVVLGDFNDWGRPFSSVRITSKADGTEVVLDLPVPMRKLIETALVADRLVVTGTTSFGAAWAIVDVGAMKVVAGDHCGFHPVLSPDKQWLAFERFFPRMMQDWRFYRPAVCVVPTTATPCEPVQVFPEKDDPAVAPAGEDGPYYSITSPPLWHPSSKKLMFFAGLYPDTDATTQDYQRLVGVDVSGGPQEIRMMSILFDAGAYLDGSQPAEKINFQVKSLDNMSDEAVTAVPYWQGYKWKDPSFTLRWDDVLPAKEPEADAE